jgi:mannose-6-phosphate isomerase-like protein (cupin superfamily)
VQPYRLLAGDVTLWAGEVFVAPKGIEHAPFAKHKAQVLLIEPRGAPNTGEAATATPSHAI